MSFIRKSYIYLLFYVFWEFMISSGRLLGSSLFKYASFIITFGLFLVCLIRTRRIITTLDGQIWFPFLLWTILGSFVYVVPGIMLIWGTAFIVVLIAVSNKMKSIFPYKYIFYFGLIQIVGQLLQMELPSIYNLMTGILFKADVKEYGSGFQGFTTNPGMTSAILVYALGTYLCFYAPTKKTVINAIVFIAIIIFIFLTGKRSGAVLALFLPAMTFFISTKNQSKLVKYGLPIVLSVVFLFYFFIQNMDYFEDTTGLRKVTQGLEMFVDSDEEIELNGREFLWRMAIQGFLENPLFGIGVSQFETWSGLETNTHNMYLQVLCEQGLIGLFLFVIPLVYCLIHTIYLLRNGHEKSYLKQILMFSLYVQLYFIIYGLSGNPTRNSYGYMMYFCAIGLLQSYQYNWKTNRGYRG